VGGRTLLKTVCGRAPQKHLGGRKGFFQAKKTVKINPLPSAENLVDQEGESNEFTVKKRKGHDRKIANCRDGSRQ